MRRPPQEDKSHKPHKHLFVEMEEHDEEEVHRRSRSGDEAPPGAAASPEHGSHRWNFGLEEDYDEAAHKWSMPHLPKLSARALTALPTALQEPGAIALDVPDGALELVLAKLLDGIVAAGGLPDEWRTDALDTLLYGFERDTPSDEGAGVLTHMGAVARRKSSVSSASLAPGSPAAEADMLEAEEDEEACEVLVAHLDDGLDENDDSTAVAARRAPLAPVQVVAFCRLRSALRVRKRQRASVTVKYVCAIVGSDKHDCGKAGEALAALLADDDLGDALEAVASAEELLAAINERLGG